MLTTSALLEQLGCCLARSPDLFKECPDTYYPDATLIYPFCLSFSKLSYFHPIINIVVASILPDSLSIIPYKSYDSL